MTANERRSPAATSAGSCFEPHLGYRLARARLASEQCRAVRFDHDHRPEELFGPRHPSPRRGDENPGEAGPRWRIVYWPAETPDRELRLIVVLAIGITHPKPGQRSAFELAERLLKIIQKERRCPSP
ncbi:MAG: hypothetical protein WAN22_10955 [Solirubrobacteraceae bacterium]